MARFIGKTALITGAATGIGRAVARRLAAEGASVALNYRNRPPDDVLNECRDAHRAGGFVDARAEAFRADVSVDADVEALFAAAIEAFGRLDVLINNAGVQHEQPSHEVEMEAFDRVLNINLRGAFLCSRAAISHFLSRAGGGVIVNNSSVHEIIPKPQYASYSIAKGGMENMTRTLALEYADKGIRVNAVGPGAIVTPINDSWANDPAARAEVESHIPMGRVGDPDEMATVFAFLASDEASYITGQTLFACGGLTLFAEFRGTWAS